MQIINKLMELRNSDLIFQIEDAISNILKTVIIFMFLTIIGVAFIFLFSISVALILSVF